mmetsp:Transcript_1959/g.4459  ORF Transcript_1959/g.4459 Transcript_1959/m.4459 type:complete len:218 (-) Transcript_1959:246-899(-)
MISSTSSSISVPIRLLYGIASLTSCAESWPSLSLSMSSKRSCTIFCHFLCFWKVFMSSSATTNSFWSSRPFPSTSTFSIRMRLSTSLILYPCFLRPMTISSRVMYPSPLMSMVLKSIVSSSASSSSRYLRDSTRSLRFSRWKLPALWNFWMTVSFSAAEGFSFSLNHGCFKACRAVRRFSWFRSSKRAARSLSWGETPRQAGDSAELNSSFWHITFF